MDSVEKKPVSEIASVIDKYMRCATGISMGYSKLSADQRMGVTHACVGILLIMIGVALFFQSFLMSIGNGFLLYGIIGVLGVEGFINFLKPSSENVGNFGVFALGLALLMMMNGWGMFGLLLELYSIFHILKERCNHAELVSLLSIASNFITEGLRYLPVVRNLVGSELKNKSNQPIISDTIPQMISSDSLNSVTEAKINQNNNAENVLSFNEIPMECKSNVQNTTLELNVNHTDNLKEELFVSQSPNSDNIEKDDHDSNILDKSTIESFLSTLHSHVHDGVISNEFTNQVENNIKSTAETLTSSICDESIYISAINNGTYQKDDMNKCDIFEESLPKQSTKLPHQNIKHDDHKLVNGGEPDNEKHIKPNNEKHMQSNNEKHIQPNNEKHIQSNYEKHIEPNNEKHVQLNNEKHIQPNNEKHIQSNNEEDSKLNNEEDNKQNSEENTKLNSEDDSKLNSKENIEATTPKTSFNDECCIKNHSSDKLNGFDFTETETVENQLPEEKHLEA